MSHNVSDNEIIENKNHPQHHSLFNSQRISFIYLIGQLLISYQIVRPIRTDIRSWLFVNES